MKIFISYKREDEKLRDELVSRLKAVLPDSFEFWTDIKRLRWGSNFPEEIRTAIMKDVDFFITVVTDRAGSSDWMLKELKLAQEREKEIRRGFILPIVKEGTSASALWNELDLDSTNYAVISPDDNEAFGRQIEWIKDKLFEIICTDFEKMLRPGLDDRIREMAGNGKWLAGIAEEVLTIVFPHREDNPIAIPELCRELQKKHPEIKETAMPALIEEMLKAKLLSGVDYDGEYMFLVEEHASWVNEFRAKEKEKIAKYAFNEYIKKRRRGTLYIDSGSTALELVLRICSYYKSPSNSLELTIITPSTGLLQLLSDTCVELGYRNDSRDSEKLKLVVPGGYIHAATQTIVQWDDNGNDQISRICKEYGIRLDVAFIGANGITAENGIYTYSNKEDSWKIDAVKNAKKTVVICDSGKFGISGGSLDSKILGWEDDFVLICNRDDGNAELAKCIERCKDRIVLV